MGSIYIWDDTWELKGYLSKVLKKELLDKGIQLITNVRHNEGYFR